MRLWLSVFAALLLRGEALAAVRTIEVDSRLVDCVGVGPQSCMRVRDAGDQPWRLFHGTIDGFMFEPGYRYKLQIEELPVADPPADGSAMRTVLREIVHKLAVEPPADPFAGKSWRLFEVVATSEAEPLRPASMITLAIDTPNGRAAGKGGCNSWFATAKIHGLELAMSGMGSTMMACPPPAMEEERAFLDALARTSGYLIEANSLSLTLKGGGSLRFRELLD